MKIGDVTTLNAGEFGLMTELFLSVQGNTSAGTADTTTQSCLVFLRIDGVTQSLQPAALRELAASVEQVRNCQYSTPDNSTIDCEVAVAGVWHPFTASPTDVTEWGPQIYAAAVAGELGDVAPYTAPE